jgi:glyoxylase-like metal-dependent hydrolase (beta-lactamase superfamily II)
VTVATDGRTVGPLSDTYVANQPKDVVNALIGSSYLERDKATHYYTPIAVNTGAKLVVIDTGLGPATFASSNGAAGQFHANLAAAGIDRSAVDMVIISHFHADHINGLLNADSTPAFPNAEIAVPEAEWAFWMDDARMNNTPEAQRGGFTNTRRVFGPLAAKVTRYGDKKELVPGITAVSAFGHTAGHTAHIISSGNESLLVQADITAGMVSLFVRIPDWHAGFDFDKAGAVATRRKLYDMAATDKMMVQGFHFPFPGVAYVEKDGAGYRTVPAVWNPAI